MTGARARPRLLNLRAILERANVEVLIVEATLVRFADE
jgi:hypothetical protein